MFSISENIYNSMYNKSIEVLFEWFLIIGFLGWIIITLAHFSKTHRSDIVNIPIWKGWENLQRWKNLQDKKGKKDSLFLSKYSWWLGGGLKPGDYSDWKFDTNTSNRSMLGYYRSNNLSCDTSGDP